MATAARLVLGSWADCHWRGATVQDTESTCPRCGAPATLQPPVRVWTRDTGWAERTVAQCRGTERHEIPTPRRGAHSYGHGQTMTVVGCGLVTIETRPVEGPPPAVVEQVKEEKVMPRGTLTPHAVREELFRRVRAGEHPTEVGKDLGLHENTASDLVRRAGIEYAHRDPISAMREARRPGKKACQRLPPDLVAEGVRLCLDEGVSVVEAGKRVGVNFRSLKHYVTKARRERAAFPAPAESAPVTPVVAPEGDVPCVETMPSYETEKAYLAQALPIWLPEEEGKYVLLQGNHLVGFFPTGPDAYEEGVRQFGPRAPFYIAKVERETPPAVPEVVIEVVRGDARTCIRCGGLLEHVTDAYCTACVPFVPRGFIDAARSAPVILGPLPPPRTCRECGSPWVKQGRDVCGECVPEVSRETPPAPVESAQGSPRTTCRDCGAPIESGNVLCWDCSAIPKAEECFCGHCPSCDKASADYHAAEMKRGHAPHSLNLSSLARHIEILASVMGGKVPVDTRLSAAADQLGSITMREEQRLDPRLAQAIKTILAYVDDGAESLSA